MRNVALAVLRGLLTALVFVALVRGIGDWQEKLLQEHLWQHGGLFDLLPSAALGTWWPTASDLLTWLVGLCLLALGVYYVPRAVMTVLVAPFTIAADLRRGSGVRGQGSEFGVQGSGTQVSNSQSLVPAVPPPAARPQPPSRSRWGGGCSRWPARW